MTVNFDVKKLRIRPWDTLYEKSPFVRNIRYRFAQLRYIAKGVTRLFVKIFNLFLETQVRLLIFCMLRIKAEIQMIIASRELKIQILSVKSPQYTFGKRFSNQKKTCVFSVKRYDNLQFLRLENEAIGGKCFLQTILQFIL